VSLHVLLDVHVGVYVCGSVTPGSYKVWINHFLHPLAPSAVCGRVCYAIAFSQCLFIQYSMLQPRADPLALPL